MICVRIATSNKIIKETRIKRQQDTIVYVAHVMLSASTTIEKLSFQYFLSELGFQCYNYI